MRTVLTLVVALLALSSPFSAQHAPNRTDVVAAVRASHPAEWHDAHRVDGPRGEAFIRRLAWVLHSSVDQRFGLNGKCGSDAISLDVIAYQGRVTFPSGKSADVQAFDVIARAGSDGAAPAWNDITDPDGCGSKWIAPTPVGGEQPKPEPVPDCADCQRALRVANGEILRLRDAVDVKDRALLDAAAQLADARGQHERDAQQLGALAQRVRELEAELAKPVGCRAKLPRWMGVGCEIVR